MSTDKRAALDQWTRAHTDMVITLNSLELSPNTNRLVWSAAVKMLSALDDLVRRMLA